MVASSEEVQIKWEGMLGRYDKVTGSGKEWPTILISSGNEVVHMLEGMTRTPT